MTYRKTPGGLEYELVRKDIKNIYLRIREGRICISAGRKYRIADIETFIDSKRAWILSRLGNTEVVLPDEMKLLGNRYSIRTVMAEKESIGPGKDGEIVICLTGRSKEDAKERLIAEYKQKAAEYFFYRAVCGALPLFEEYRIPMPEIQVKDIRSAWGKCAYTKGKVIFALMLIEKPYRLIEYVAVHELAHFIYHDHQKAFHALMTKVMPDYKERRKALKNS